MSVPAKWLSVAADMLEMAADKFSNHGCNDWNWPADWTEDEKDICRQSMSIANNDQSYDPEDWEYVGDWQMMSFLSKVLREEAKCQT